MAWVWLAGAISLEVVATLNLKLSEGFTRFWPSVVVILGYIGSFSLLGATLKRLDVGTVYAIWSGAGTVVVVFVGIMLFGESANGSRMVGIGVITLGVVVLNLSGGGHGGEAVEAGAKVPPEEPQSEPGAGIGKHVVGTPGIQPVAHLDPMIPRQRSGKHVAPPRTTTVRAFTPSPTAQEQNQNRGRRVAASADGETADAASAPGGRIAALNGSPDADAASAPGGRIAALTGNSDADAASSPGDRMVARAAAAKTTPAAAAPAVSRQAPTNPRGVPRAPRPRTAADDSMRADSRPRPAPDVSTPANTDVVSRPAPDSARANADAASRTATEHRAPQAAPRIPRQRRHGEIRPSAYTDRHTDHPRRH